MYGKKSVQEKFRALWDWTESNIAGIFVQSQSWSQGIGGRLLDYIKKQHSRLTLRVYAKNTRAVRFYQRESFWIQMEETDEMTGQKEYVMLWED